MTIGHFSGDYDFLSNFYLSPFRAGIRYPTVEHYYQAHKTRNDSLRKRIARLPTPLEAKRAGQSLKLRSDWDAVKLDVMRTGLHKKFALGTQLAARLLTTGDAMLIEGNMWGDKFWGANYNLVTDKWEGKNWLGTLLMARRAELRSKLRP